eukprot:5603813-Amphidinium_carterae.1
MIWDALTLEHNTSIRTRQNETRPRQDLRYQNSLALKHIRQQALDVVQSTQKALTPMWAVRDTPKWLIGFCDQSK